jgi:hypothetical protein
MVERHLRKVIGQPCWGASYDPQLNLSINFGRPRLKFREPVESRSRSLKIRQIFAKRHVTVRGRWWFWIWCAYWRLELPKRLGNGVTGASSRRAIRRALKALEGQRLTSVTVDSLTGRTRLDFDLDTRLEIRRFGPDDDGDMWTLYEPGDRCLSIRGDGYYSVASCWEGDHEYAPIAEARSSSGSSHRRTSTK